jgi:hypothetical protein
MTRDDLMRVIAHAVRRSFTFATETQALGAADTVLRDLKAMGVRILAPKRRSAQHGRTAEIASAERADGRGDLLDEQNETDRTGGACSGEHGHRSRPPG